MFSFELYYQKTTNQDQRSHVLDYFLSLLEKLAEFIDCFKTGNRYVERLIGSIRRECINHVIALSERHLLKRLSSYFIYYNKNRTHCGFNKYVPTGRLIKSKPSNGSKIIKLSRVGGLHNRYQWKEAISVKSCIPFISTTSYQADHNNGNKTLISFLHNKISLLIQYSFYIWY